jgi:predicted small lipoprotein YifL
MKRVLMVLAALVVAGCASKGPEGLSPEPKTAAADRFDSTVDCRYATMAERRNDPRCASPGTRTYSRDQLYGTGQPTLDGALQTLDPSLRRLR